MTSWIKDLNEVLELLKKATPNHPVFRGGKFAILSGEKPKYPVHQGFEGQNSTLIRHLDDMKKKGHLSHYEPVLGKYGEFENSFLVYNPNFEKIKHLGEKLGQESVILSNRGTHHLAYTNGPDKGMANPHVPTTGEDVGSSVVQHATEPQDLYTVGKDVQGKKMIFTIPVDFGTTVPLKGKPMGKSSGTDFPFHFDPAKLVPAHSDKHHNVVTAFRRIYHANKNSATGVADQ